jgi:hypothetical protein
MAAQSKTSKTNLESSTELAQHAAKSYFAVISDNFSNSKSVRLRESYDRPNV